MSVQDNKPILSDSNKLILNKINSLLKSLSCALNKQLLICSAFKKSKSDITRANMPQLIDEDHSHCCDCRLYCNEGTGNTGGKVSDKKDKAEVKQSLRDVRVLSSEK